MKVSSKACERNWKPILERLTAVLDVVRKSHSSKEPFESSETQKGEKLPKGQVEIFEVGSGTGQHAVYISDKLEDVRWQTSDHPAQFPQIRAWTQDVKNLPEPVEYIAGAGFGLPAKGAHIVFTANTLHIMPWSCCLSLFRDIASAKVPYVAIYGPFIYSDKPTADSNILFDRWLKDRDPASGIRSFEMVIQELEALNFQLLWDHSMPANNRFLFFKSA